MWRLCQTILCPVVRPKMRGWFLVCTSNESSASPTKISRALRWPLQERICSFSEHDSRIYCQRRLRSIRPTTFNQTLFFSLLCFSGTHCTSMAKELESQKEVEKCELIASYKPLLHFPKDLSEYEYVESIQAGKKRPTRIMHERRFIESFFTCSLDLKLKTVKRKAARQERGWSR